MLWNNAMEHNHTNLIYGFLASFFVFGTGITMGILSRAGTDLHSQLVITVVAIFFIISGIIILKRTFQKRDNCPICKVKYNFGKKKGKN